MWDFLDFGLGGMGPKCTVVFDYLSLLLSASQMGPMMMRMIIPRWTYSHEGFVSYEESVSDGGPLLSQHRFEFYFITTTQPTLTTFYLCHLRVLAKVNTPIL